MNYKSIFEAQYVPRGINVTHWCYLLQSQSIDGNALIQLTKDKRGSFLDSMGVTWDNRKNQTDQFKCAPYFNIIGT